MEKYFKRQWKWYVPVFVLGLVLVVVVLNFDKIPSMGVSNPEAKAVKVVGEGASCDTPAGIACGEGFFCLPYEKDPSLGKFCKRLVVEEKDCENTKDLVCGLRGRNKNGYLNECHAERYGATVLHKGLCQVDEGVKGRCDARVRTVGLCEKLVYGFEFVGGCRQVGVAGCEGEIPFDTLEGCQRKCEPEA